jgi:hypothetical protein
VTVLEVSDEQRVQIVESSACLVPDPQVWRGVAGAPVEVFDADGWLGRYMIRLHDFCATDSNHACVVAVFTKVGD